MAWTPPHTGSATPTSCSPSTTWTDIAYITLSPKKLESGDHVVPAIARELQEKGEIPPGEIKGVKRVR